MHFIDSIMLSGLSLTIHSCSVSRNLYAVIRLRLSAAIDAADSYKNADYLLESLAFVAVFDHVVWAMPPWWSVEMIKRIESLFIGGAYSLPMIIYRPISLPLCGQILPIVFHFSIDFSTLRVHRYTHSHKHTHITETRKWEATIFY